MWQQEIISSYVNYTKIIIGELCAIIIKFHKTTSKCVHCFYYETHVLHTQTRMYIIFKHVRFHPTFKINYMRMKKLLTIYLSVLSPDSFDIHMIMQSLFCRTDTI